MIYHGNKNIKELYYGRRKIDRVYKGSNLIYDSDYPSGTLLFESGTPGTYTLVVDKRCTVRLDMCGGGGGGGMALMDGVSTGGSAGYVYGNMNLLRGSYTIVIGSGGGMQNKGGDTSFLENIAGGGYGGSGKHDGGGGSTTVVTQGLTGSNGYAGSSSGRIGNYGAGGWRTDSGTGGYVKIEVV